MHSDNDNACAAICRVEIKLKIKVYWLAKNVAEFKRCTAKRFINQNGWRMLRSHIKIFPNSQMCHLPVCDFPSPTFFIELLWKTEVQTAGKVFC